MWGMGSRSAAGGALFAAVLVFSGGVAVADGQGRVEVLHWWTSGGEARAVDTVKELLGEEGYTWVDFAVAGGIDNAMEVLDSRLRSGNPPAAAQILAASIEDWAEHDMYADLGAVARSEGWDDILLESVRRFYKYDDEYVAVPLNIHRTNWMWYDPAVFRDAGVDVPSSWDGFVAAAHEIEESGDVAVIIGDQAWQQSLVFQALVAGEMDGDQYRRAFEDRRPEALRSERVIRAFEKLAELREVAGTPERSDDWDAATREVIRGNAAAQVMGDWAKSEFIGAGRQPGRDFGCRPVPGTDDRFLYSVDSLVMFQLDDAEDRRAQMTTARLLLRERFQAKFNLHKGSIPVRAEAMDDRFDDCARRSLEAFEAAEDSDALRPAFSMLMPGPLEGAVNDVISAFYHGEYSATEAAEQLARVATEYD